MLKKLLTAAHSQEESHPQEGDLFHRVDVFGRTFELLYGYYDEKDRSGPPDVIYPDFIKEPVYTDGGEPLVTMMQDACSYYKGNIKNACDAICGECRYFDRGEEWFGICRSPENKKDEKVQSAELTHSNPLKNKNIHINPTQKEKKQ